MQNDAETFTERTVTILSHRSMLRFLLVASRCSAPPLLLADACNRVTSTTGFTNISGSHWSDCHVPWPADFDSALGYDISFYGSAIAIEVDSAFLLIHDSTFRNCSACKDGAVSFVGFQGELLRCQGWSCYAARRSFARLLSACLPDSRICVEDTSVTGGLAQENTLMVGVQANCPNYFGDGSCQKINISWSVGTVAPASGLWFSVYWNFRLLWQFCTLFSLSGATPVGYGTDAPATPTRFFSAHCIAFLNTTAVSLSTEHFNCLIVVAATTHATLTSCVFAGNTILAYFGRRNSGAPFSLVVIDSILEPGPLILTEVSVELVRDRIPPIGSGLHELECPLGSATFTSLVADYGKRRRILDFWIWSFLIESA
jgi:hypothetical protein